MNSPTPTEAARLKCARSLAQMIDEWEGQPRNETGVDKLSNLIDLRLRRFWPEAILPTPPETAEEVVKAEVCRLCDGGGWECFGLGYGDPHFRVCEDCGNPEGHPAP
jgi:hypothetical protein